MSETDMTADENVTQDDTDSKQEASTPESHNAGKIVERVLCLILFGVIGYFVFWAICILAFVQFIFTLVNHEANDELKKFTANLSEYLRQIGRYMGYASDERPCPFGPFPNVE